MKKEGIYGLLKVPTQLSQN